MLTLSSPSHIKECKRNGKFGFVYEMIAIDGEPKLKYGHLKNIETHIKYTQHFIDGKFTGMHLSQLTPQVMTNFEMRKDQRQKGQPVWTMFT
ncbi:MAG: hypothetical protein DI535_18965 [Citrobacter freundii]|nr:MAG: hypothetical protein DI535_18965 [Citrobacter freundii]